MLAAIHNDRMIEVLEFHLDKDKGNEWWRTAVAIDSSRIFWRSERILPNKIVQMLDPIFSLLSGQMPYSLGMTLSASSFATYNNIMFLSLYRAQAYFTRITSLIA